MADQRASVPIAVVVDDDFFIRMDAAATLTDAGFSVIEAENADDALRHIEAGPIDAIELLFTDVQMPGAKDGFALAREVASRWPKVGIIVASGLVSPQDGELPAGATFIGKPFSYKIVHEHIMKVLPPERRPKPLQDDEVVS